MCCGNECSPWQLSTSSAVTLFRAVCWHSRLLLHLQSGRSSLFQTYRNTLATQPIRTVVDTVAWAGSMFQRASTLPVTVVTMPPDTKKQCNSATSAPVSCKGSSPVPSPVLPKPVQEPPKMSPRDYIFGKTIGEGSFSTVSLFLVHTWSYSDGNNTLIKSLLSTNCG